MAGVMHRGAAHKLGLLPVGALPSRGSTRPMPLLLLACETALLLLPLLSPLLLLEGLPS